MKLVRLCIGIMLFAIGIVFTIQANFGIGPWDSFHQGISLHTKLTFGQASITVGAILIVVNFFMKQYIGIGTILNTLGVGFMIDLFMSTQWLSSQTNILMSLLFLLIGMFSIALGAYFYIGAGYGSGPIDGLMIGLHLILKKPVGLVRGSLELFVCLLGFLLGGQVGVGTLIIAFSVGPIFQITFRLLNFEVKDVHHKYITFRKT